MTNFENTGSISTVRLHRMLATLKGHGTPLTVNSVSDDEKGAFIGKYQRRGDATKVVAEAAYRPEPKWQ
jgi:hypothetical protein